MAEIIGTDGNDTLVGTDADFLGQGGDDTIHGANGNDLIDGLGGNNFLYGDAGDDRFLITVLTSSDPRVTSTLFGGLGYDTLDFSGSPAGITLDRTYGMGFYARNFAGSGVWAGSDSSIEHIIGSRFADRITTVYAVDADLGDGNDVIYIGSGANPFVTPEKLDSTVRGGSGDDSLGSAASWMRLYGEAGNDRLRSDNGTDAQLFGGAGDDVFVAVGAALLDGGDGSDTVESGISQVADLATGRMVNDSLGPVATLVSIENIFVGNGNTDTRYFGTAYGNEGGNILTTYVGSPGRLYGRGGNDIINGGDRNDLLDGGDGDDFLNPGAGNNIVTGGFGIDTIAIPFSFASATISFQRAYTDITGRHFLIADTFTERTDGIEIFQFRDVTINNADNNRLVDDLYYLVKNRDLTDNNAEQHWSDFGWREQRDPNALFDTSAYVGANRDAVNVDPLVHYLNNGVRNGRDPSVLFDNEQYLAKNPDVAVAGINPFFHYVAFGQAEQRSIYAAVGSEIVTDFDREFYLLSNTDVALSGIDPLTHFQQFGWREGRDPNAYLDTDYYRQHNPDVTDDPLAHYSKWGWHEGRDPSASFDTSAYLATYADIAASGIDPLQHFLVWGRLDGHDAFPVM